MAVSSRKEIRRMGCSFWHDAPGKAGTWKQIHCLLALLLLIALPVGAQKGSSCPAEYLRFSKQHSFCLPPSATCKPVASGVNTAEKTAILKLHNELRNGVALGSEKKVPPAADMVQMQWDNQLADIMQKYLMQCKFQHDCGDCRMCDRFPVGQNLYQLVSWGSQKPSPNWTECIYSWYNEVNLLDSSFDVQNFFFPEKVMIGHFTQVAWASSWKVGCGHVTFASSGGKGYTVLLGCNYGPAGNIFGSQMYKKGQACSSCPGNTCCGVSCNSPNVSTTFKGLCNALNDRGPVTPMNVSNALFWYNFTQQKPPAVSWAGKRWTIISSIPDNYARLILQAGNSSVVNFTTSIKPRSSDFCFTFEYRKGPNVDGNPSNNKLTVIFTIPSQNFHTEIAMGDDSKTFIFSTIRLSWQQETKVAIKFAVPAGSQDQYFDIKNILVKPGKC